MKFKTSGAGVWLSRDHTHNIIVMDVEGTDGSSSEDNQVVFNSSIVIVASVNNSPLELCSKNDPICLGVFKAAYYQHVGEPSWLISGREYASPENYF